MARLNDMLAKNGNLSQTLEEDNFSLEAEFINRLKDAERVSSGATLASVCYNLSLISPPQDISKLQANAAATKAAKVVLEQELIECERQIMLLERKLELEKETQAAYVAARRFYYFPAGFIIFPCFLLMCGCFADTTRRMRPGTSSRA